VDVKRSGSQSSPAMAHMAVVEAVDGKTVEWMEKVSDEQYRAGPGDE
jgi:hypothetical protein